uniref:Reverse transcriptase domain-containing protein n=1 Tax=Oryza brachyantha TaxID=4533 RepID=J3L5V2_ORYBR
MGHWIEEDDRNTAFFQHAARKRKQKSNISSLFINGSFITNLSEIASCFITFFQNLFQTSCADTGDPTIMPENEQQDLILPVTPTQQEILEILKSMKKDAAPGPDGFNVAFYRTSWDCLKQDITKLVQNFYATANIPEGINSTNIVLIPKKVAANNPVDFRPISLCNVSYKILAKSLANQIKDKLNDLINPNQQAFIKGRRPSTNIILAQEIIHSFSLSSYNTNAFLLKLDLSKAFDRLEWSFIANSLKKKGFDDHFIKLVLACISTPCFSVTINGETFGNFRSQRGIRQGCPLSPYLFVLALNSLAETLVNQANLGNIKGSKLSVNGPSIYSIFYADDLIITGEASYQEARTILSILQDFVSSGQMPNWGKSSVAFSKCTAQMTRTLVKSFFPVADISSSTNYLGHPLLISAATKNSAYSFLIDKFKSKLSTLKANKLSHAGRLTLIRSAFASIPVYYMSHILMSNQLIKKLTSIIRKFWWKGSLTGDDTDGICFRSWQYICKPKNEGGLGVRDLWAINKALLIQSAWNFLSRPNELISTVLKAKYFPDRPFWLCSHQGPKSIFWSSIIKIKPFLSSSCHWQLARGDISIWNQPWVSIWSNIHNHIHLHSLTSRLPSRVSELWTQDKHWIFSYISEFLDDRAIREIARVQYLPHDQPDRLCWSPNSSGECSTKSAYKQVFNHLHPAGTPVPSAKLTLLNMVGKNKFTPPKIKTFFWKLVSKALPTRSAIHLRIPDFPPQCCRCNQLENEVHIFFLCPFAKLVWMASSFHLNIFILPSVENIEIFSTLC